MSMKKILVSSDNGKYIEIDAGIDDGQLSASIITVNTASFNTTQNGLLQIVGGRIEVITGSGNNYKINYDTTLGKFVAEYDTIGDLGGDLTGISAAAKVKSVENVTGGILSTTYGGTGKSSFGVGNLVTSNGDGLVYSGNGDKVVSVNSSGDYVFANKNMLNFTPMTGAVAFLYTGSVLTQAQVQAGAAAWQAASYKSLWTKPNNCRFIRVICQGGGGPGGAGGSDPSTAGFRGGAGGGGGGGYADITFYGPSINLEVPVTAGYGGLGWWTNSTALEFGNPSGAASSFGTYIISYGGQRGSHKAQYNGTSYAFLTTPPGGAAGGSYLNQSSAGANGPTGNATAGLSAASVGGIIGGAPGGGSGGYNNGNGGNGGGNSLVAVGAGGNGVGINGSFTSINPFKNIKKYYLNNVLINGDLPNLLCSGGGGGWGGRNVSGFMMASSGGSPEFGSGGGGGGGSAAANYSSWGYGGNGGKGYVLIICY